MLKEKNFQAQQLEYFAFLYKLDQSDGIFQQKSKGNDQAYKNLQNTSMMIQNEIKIEDYLWYTYPEDITLGQRQTHSQIQQKPFLNHVSDVQQTEQIINQEEQNHKKDESKSKFTKRYRKNICGYISKYVIKKILSLQYSSSLKKTCKKYKCDVQKFKAFYQSKRQKLFGPNDLITFFGADEQSEEQICIRKIFVMLFQKILRKKYLELALAQGKMSNLQAYIQYKNKYLLYFSELFRF